MPKRTDETAFQAARTAFLAHRKDFLKRIAAAVDPSSRLALEIQYHRETLRQYRQIFLTVVIADPSRRNELERIFSDDTDGERLWLTDKDKRKEAIRIAKLIKKLTPPKPERPSRKERQRQKKRQSKGLMNHQR